MRKIWDIPGGVHPPENKSQSNQTAIRHIPLAKEIILPLSQHIGAEAIPCIEVGQNVLKGEKVADAQGFVSAPVHASTSGKVIAIEERAVPHPSGLNAMCVVIEPDGEDRWCELYPCENYEEQDTASLVEKIRDAGIAGMGGAGFPTSIKLKPKSNHTIHTLILNGTECEPYITADDVFMRERADEIVAGAQLLAYILGSPETILIGIEDNKPEAIVAMKAAVADTSIEVVVFPTKYPSGGEKQLIQILTGKEVPHGDIPASIGIVLQNVATVAAAYRAIRYGEPLISRVTTVVGESLGIQGNIDVPLGTPISHVLDQHEFRSNDCARLVIGGPMMGYAMTHSEIPVVKTTNCVLVPSNQEMPEQPPTQACIRCGMCAEACPASLLPQQLFWFSQSEDIDKLKSHNLFDCIECGACSFVCPSNIPLVQHYRASKGIIRTLEENKLKSDRSRERFENRKLRIAKAEEEKEAKRIARKKAAEEAKKKLAENKDAPKKEAKPAEPTNTDIDPDKQRKKLERGVSSASSRVERATKQLETAQSEGQDDRIESLQARLKQAEQNLSDAQTKLDEFLKGDQTPASPATTTIKEKVSMSPKEQAEKTIATLQKRIATAEEKLQEAKDNNAPTVDALAQGVEKLKSKLADAEKQLQDAGDTPADTQEQPEAMSAADAAIAKAQAKAAAMANMSDAEKAQAQIESLKTRLEKAEQRLEKAEAENSEHVDAFKQGVDKLKKKLKEAEEAL